MTRRQRSRPTLKLAGEDLGESPKSVRTLDWLDAIAGRYRLEKLTLALRPFALAITGVTIAAWLLAQITRAETAALSILILGWVGAFLVFLAPRIRKPDLEQTAARLDERTSGLDQFRSALSFASRPKSSAMERLSVERAEQRLDRLSLPSLFPLRLSPSVYVALLLSLVVLGHWTWGPVIFSAPPTELSGAGPSLADSLRERLGEVVERDPELKALFERMETTESQEELLSMLEDIRSKLRPQGLDEALLATDLELLASAEDPENSFQAALAQGDLSGLAENLRQSAGNLDSLGGELKKFLEDLPSEGRLESRSMRDVAEALRAAEEALQNQDSATAAENLESAARRLEELSDQQQAREERQAASDALESLQRQMRQESQTQTAESQEAAGAGAPGGGGAVAAPSEAPAEQASSGQVTGGTGDASSDASADNVETEGAGNPLEARFEVELRRARSLVREPSGRLKRDLPSLKPETARSRLDGRVRVNQEEEEPLSVDVIPRHLREQIRQYLIAIHDGIPDDSGSRKKN